MKILNSLDRFEKNREPVFLAAGFFDGVHLAHQKLLSRTVAAARAGGSAWVLTFDRHPRQVIDPSKAPGLLTSTEQKLRLFEKAGVHGCIVAPFTSHFAALSPEDFVAFLVKSAPGMARIFVGRNYTFGQYAKGDSRLLKKLAALHGVRTTVIAPVLYRGAPVSSTRIRKAVSSGKMDYAGKMLGRPYAVAGKVISGLRLGRKLGFPTANIGVALEILLPPPGVYVGLAQIRGRALPAVINLGFRPTILREGEKILSLEAHVLDFKGDLYGVETEVVFLDKVRDEKRFKSLPALRKQISGDIDRARKWFSTRGNIYSARLSLDLETK